MKPELKLQLKQILAPRMIQLVKLLQLPQIELQQLLQAELVNTVLEVDDEEVDASDEEMGGEVGEDEKGEGDGEGDDEGDAEDDFEVEDYLIEYLEDDQDISYRPRRDYSEEFVEKVPVVVTTLTDHLRSQLHVRVRTDRELEIGEYIVNSINGRGYLESTVEDIANVLDEKQEKVEEILTLIQTFDPPGVGARNLSECLLIQLRLRGQDKSVAAKIVQNYLKELAGKSFTVIARNLKVPEKEVIEAAKEIASLQPVPGSGRWSDSISDNLAGPYEVEYVTPDIVVEKHGDKLVAVLNETRVPNLRIAQSYRSVLNNPDAYGKKEYQFIRKKLREARLLVGNLEDRRRTILNVMNYILEVQQGFFESGPAHLRPLVMRDVADALNVHESTISRIVNDKYVETPQGIYELRYFFSSSLRGHGTADPSARSVKTKIRQLVDNEDKAHPLTDHQIKEALSREGIKIARRTIGKYRDELKILSAKLRREA
jgi:RNA polymerase sigma-54 factor